MKQLSLIKNKYKSCTLTGHRILPKNFDEAALTNQLEELIKDGVDTFYNGMAMGFDLVAASALISLKERYPQIRLIACVPFYGQESRFPKKWQDAYTNAISRFDETVVLSEHYFDGCYFKRNDYMIDCADLLFAYCVRAQGGTAYTVRSFIRKKGEENVLFFESNPFL